jgi:hypothetical protein
VRPEQRRHRHDDPIVAWLVASARGRPVNDTAHFLTAVMRLSPDILVRSCVPSCRLATERLLSRPFIGDFSATCAVSSRALEP